MKIIVLAVFAISVCLFFVASPQAVGSAKVPEIITLGTLSDQYEPVIFTHARHATMSGNCGSCHHEHGNSGTLPCKDCHSITPSAFKSSVTRSFMACKNCHSEYSPSSPKMPGLKVAYHAQCFQCHRGMSNVGLDPKGCAELCHSKKEMKVSKTIK